MSKHKLFLPDSYSPLNTSVNECNIPKNHEGDSVILTSVRGVKRNKNLTSSPISRKNLRKTESKSAASGPNTAATQGPTAVQEPSTAAPDMQNARNNKNISDIEEQASEKPEDTPAIGDFDSDPGDDFYSKNLQKLPYTMQEDELILKFVLKGQNIFKVGSISLWKYLESKKENPKRTYQSLKNRFLRNIKPYLFTTYQHLVKDQETKDRILSKFPELKKRMAIKKTLPNVEISLRDFEAVPISPNGKAVQENKTVEQKENTEKTKSSVPDKLNDAVEAVAQPEPEFSVSGPLNPLNRATLCRKVNFNKKSITVSVNLTDRNCSEGSSSPLVKISERFKELKSKRERFYCPSCGRVNRLFEGSASSLSEDESDIIIPNSVDSDADELKNVEKKKLNSDAKSCSQSNQNLHPSENPPGTQDSNIPVNYDDEGTEIDIRSKITNSDESEASEDSYITKKEPSETEDSVLVTPVERKSKRATFKKKTSSKTKRKTKDSDGEIDVIYKNAVAGFRKLINADEEKMLLKKCLYKNRDMIGFNSDSEKNLDSYFLESFSPDVDIPTFTKNYSTSLQSSSNETDSRSASCSDLASNMLRMLANEK